MKFLKFFAALLLTGGFIYALDNSFTVKDQPLPAFGRLMNPFSGFWRNAEPISAGLTAPSDLQLQGLTAPVKISYDDRSVPHVFAENANDAVFVQGYLHAKDRLWQMDISVRKVGGRLAEVAGKKGLESDRLERRSGMLWAAENALKGWQKDPMVWKFVESYTAGVNAYIATLKPKDYPIEFKLMGYAPEAWSPLKTALFSKAMAESLAKGERDLQATNSYKMLGAKSFDYLFPEYFKEQSPIIPTNTSFNFTAPAAMQKVSTPPADLGFIEETPLPSTERGTGSNNWAVSASKTANGHPILCGDPHLNLTLPSIWYEMQLATPEFNAYGISLPGVPFIVIGFNENIAWTQTNVGHDVADWYTIKWKDEKREEYLLDGKYIKADIRIEEFTVKGLGFVKDTVRYTVWGPVTYDHQAGHPKASMAYHWLAHDVPTTPEAGVFYQLNKAKNYDEYSTALKDYNCPAQNFAFACKNGDIALKLGGQLPMKNKEQGRFIQDGTTAANAWHGFIPREQNPSIKNPARGFVSSANQQSTAPNYPYYYNSERFEPYRGRILNRKLKEMEKITMEDMMKLQTDNYGLDAEEALPLMLKHLDTTQLSIIEKVQWEALKNWKYEYIKEDIAPALYSAWSDTLYKLVWDEFQIFNQEAYLLAPTDWRTVALMHDDPTSKYFDNITTPEKETIKDICTQSFKAMSNKVVALTLKNLGKFNHGIYKDTYIPHLVPTMKGFSRMELQTNGSRNALNSMKLKHGPSWRMVVEMGDTPKAYVVYPGGTSGNPGSKNYDAYVDKWVNGEYYEAVFLKNADEKNARVVGTQTVK
jgi:penicillin G amidase